MPTLGYDRASIVGTLTPEAILAAQDLLRLWNPDLLFDPLYLEHQQEHHGGIPIQQWFRGDSGSRYRLTRFLNLGGIYDPPMRESLLYTGADERTGYTLETAVGEPRIAAGCAPFLVPFAVSASSPPYREAREPDDWDLVCFDYRKDFKKPAVAAWTNSAFVHESEQSRLEQREIKQSRFIDRAARSFEEFLQALRIEPE